uniref:Selenium-binding protein 1 n=1 Tax=Ascaris suum TaxID=6253 RepID=F1L0D8_ASCSU
MMLACELKKRCCSGPGYASPEDAFLNGPREKFLFVTCAHTNSSRPDMIASADVDPTSPTFCKVISRVDLPNIGDEVHHSGWNACSSCYGDKNAKRSHLVVPCLLSSRIYFIDTLDPKNLKLHKTLEPDAAFRHDVGFPHTTHCLADGNIMISTLSDADGNHKGDFFLVNGKDFDAAGTWIAEDSKKPEFNYDFWYQPRQNVMISSEWGAPAAIKQGFNMKHVQQGLYGNKIHVWDWKEHMLKQSIELDARYGAVPLEVRFLHEPTSTHCFVGTALGSTVYHIYKLQDEERYTAEKVIVVPPKNVENWMFSEMPALITDILISMDDKFLYISCWIHGDVRQYDISDPFKPKLVGQVFVGGSINDETTVNVKNDPELEERPAARYVKGQRIEGGPQMLQLSLDGKRLYVTTSLFSKWDEQFYPKMKKTGSRMVKIDVNTNDGGLKLDEDFLVDFGAIPGGPFYAHEMRYPDGDCTSDIWV